MPAKLSKEVTDRMRDCRYVLSAFDTEGARIAEKLSPSTQSNLEATDEEAGYSSVLGDLRHNMSTALDGLVGADGDVSAAAAWESSLRAEHRDKSEQQGFWIVGLRRTVIGQFVAPDLENLGLQAVDVRDSITVARRSQLIGDRFEAPNLGKLLGESRFEEPTDLSPYVGQIQDASEKLLILNAQINEAARRTTRARLEKTKRMKEYDRLYLRSTRIFEDFCRLAGEDDLADRIRTASTRSASSGQASEDDVPGDAADPIGDVPAPQDPPGTPEPVVSEEPSQEV